MSWFQFLPVRWPSLFALLAAGLCGLIDVRMAMGEETYQVEVNILSATIHAGETPIGTAKRGEKLTVHAANADYYLVDLPAAQPPQHGWIGKQDVHRVEDPFAEHKRRLAALPADQRQQAVADFNSRLTALGDLEKRFNELDARHQWRESLGVARQAAQEAEELFGGKSTMTAYHFAILGIRLKYMGDYRAAQKFHEQALAIYREVLGEKHADTAGSLGNLGVVAEDLGDYPAARKYYEQALAIQREVLGEKHAATATSLNNLGNVANAMGDYPVAQKYHEQALAIRREVLGEKHADTAASLNNLGILAHDMGDYAAARKYYEQALGIQREVLGEKHADIAASLNNLGNVADEMGDYPAARKYHEQALAIRREVLGEKHSDTAASLNNLGLVAEDLGDYPAARKYHEQALAIRREVLGEKHAATAASLNNLGLVARDMGDYPAAPKYYEQALAIKREVLGEKHADTAGSECNLGRVEAAAGDWQEAAESFEQARRIARRHVARTLPGLSEKEQLAFLQNTEDWQFHASLSLGLTRRDDPRLAAASAAWLLNGKAVAEETLAERTRLAREATGPAAREALKQWTAVRGQLSLLSQKVPPLAGQAPWRQQVAALEAREEEWARKLAASGAGVDRGDPWVSLAELRGKLPAEALLVDIVKFRPSIFTAKGNEAHFQAARYIAWLIPPAGERRIKIVDLGEAARLDPLVVAVRRAMDAAGKNINANGEAAAEKEIRASLRALSVAALDPILAQAEGATRLLLSPDGALWFAPFAALPLADGRYAIEKYQIDYLLSGRELLSRQAGADHKPAAPAILADPDFDLAPAEAVAQTQAVLRDQFQEGPPPNSLAMRGTTGGSFSLIGHVDRLPGTADEAQLELPGLQKLCGVKPRLFLYKQALKGVFKQLKRPRIVVMATHGFFFADQETKPDERRAMSEHRGAAVAAGGKPLENPLLRCGLLLAGCNRRAEAGAEDDGILTGMEIVGTDLRGTELVVLSACQTGLGDIHSGQGVAGLRQAFQLAGAQRVVATLWRIPDEETAWLMAAFFGNLSGGQTKRVGEALHSAQLQMIKGRRAEHNAAHPFYWAAFTLTGE